MKHSKKSTYPEIDSRKLKIVLDAYCKKEGIRLSDLSERVGFSRCFFRDCINRGAMSRVGINYLANNCDIPFSAYEKKDDPEEPEKEQAMTSNSTDIIAKLDELIKIMKECSSNLTTIQNSTIAEIGKLGNIEMQQLEYLKEIKDKPSGYKPYVK